MVARAVEEIGLKAMEHASVLMPVLLASLNDNDSIVARQSIVSGTNIFCIVLEELSLQVFPPPSPQCVYKTSSTLLIYSLECMFWSVVCFLWNTLYLAISLFKEILTFPFHSKSSVGGNQMYSIKLG